MTWWTRHDESEPDLSDDENEDEKQDTQTSVEDGKMTINDKTDSSSDGKQNDTCMFGHMLFG